MEVSDTLSITISINTASETQINLEEPILYPNPNNGIFYLKVPAFWSESSCTISNLSGRVIWEGLLPQELNQLDLQELVNGTYLLKLEKNQYKIHYRFVKIS
jgi:hypothetical protein